MNHIIEQYPYLKDINTLEEFRSKFESDPMLYQEMKDLFESNPEYAWRVKYLSSLAELVKNQPYDLDALVAEYPFMSDYKSCVAESLRMAHQHKSLRKELKPAKNPNLAHRYAVLMLEKNNAKWELHYDKMRTDPEYAADYNQKVEERKARDAQREQEAVERHAKLLEEMKTNPLAGIEALANLNAARSFIGLGKQLFNQREDLFEALHRDGILVKQDDGKFDFVKSEHRHHYRKSILNF